MLSSLRRRFQVPSLLGRYWRILKPFRGVYTKCILLLLAYEGIQILGSYQMSMMIRLFGDKANYWWWVLFFVGLVIYDETFIRLDNLLDWHIIIRQNYPLYRYLKLGAIKKFLQMDIDWHQKHNSGALVGKVAQGVEKVEDIMGMIWIEFIPTTIQAVFSLIPLLFISPLAVAISALSFLLFVRFSLKNNKERRPSKERRFDLYETEWHRSIEIVQSVETNYMFGQTDRLINEQADLHQEIMDIGRKEAHRGIYHYNRLELRIIRFARVAILGIWGYQLINGGMDIPTLIFVYTLTERLFSSFWRFSRLIEKTSESAEGANRLANLLEEETGHEAEGEVTTPKTQPVGVELKGVRFTYKKEYDEEQDGLHDVTLDIPAGSVVALVGPSGAGKTTIRKIVTGLMEIQGGDIRVGGVSVKDWDPEKLLEQFSYVPQGDDVFLFNGTVRDNIAFARPKASMEEVERAAVLAGIHDFIMSMAEGYETVVGERGKRLSGGQKQRVALARAILADRPVLILDEATSAVDAITEEEIQQKMAEILHGKTSIIIAHRLSTVWDIANKIVVLERGRKVEEGTHAELMALNGLYSKMALLQTK